MSSHAGIDDSCAHAWGPAARRPHTPLGKIKRPTKGGESARLEARQPRHDRLVVAAQVGPGRYQRRMRQLLVVPG
jgi:hypothetical protein